MRIQTINRTQRNQLRAAWYRSLGPALGDERSQPWILNRWVRTSWTLAGPMAVCLTHDKKMSPDCPLGRRWYKMAQSSHVIWDFEAERDQDCWIHRNARTAGGKRNGKLSGTLCARFKLDFQSFQNVDDMNNWCRMMVRMGTYRLLHELYDNMITFQFSRSLLHMFKCSSCVSILCVMVFGVPVVSENVGNEAQSHRGENYHLSGHSGAIAMGIIPFTHIIIPIWFNKS